MVERGFSARVELKSGLRRVGAMEDIFRGLVYLEFGGVQTVFRKCLDIDLESGLSMHERLKAVRAVQRQISYVVEHYAGVVGVFSFG